MLFVFNIRALSQNIIQSHSNWRNKLCFINDGFNIEIINPNHQRLLSIFILLAHVPSSCASPDSFGAINVSESTTQPILSIFDCDPLLRSCFLEHGRQPQLDLGWEYVWERDTEGVIRPLHCLKDGVGPLWNNLVEMMQRHKRSIKRNMGGSVVLSHDRGRTTGWKIPGRR